MYTEGQNSRKYDTVNTDRVCFYLQSQPSEDWIPAEASDDKFWESNHVKHQGKTLYTVPE
jgi:hypothetical protein